MHLVVLASVILALAYSAPLQEDSQATIVDYESTNDGKGSYSYRFKTSNDLTREETGTVVNPGGTDEYTFVKGSYSFKNSDGKEEVVYYQADIGGFTLTGPPRQRRYPGIPPNLIASIKNGR